MEHLGTFDKERIARITKEVVRIAAARRDFKNERKDMKLAVVENDLVLEVSGKRDELSGEVKREMFSFRRPALLQLAGTLDVPTKFLDRLQDKGHRDIVAELFTKLLNREANTATKRKGEQPRAHVIRTLDDEVDAVLSDSYRAFSNADILALALAELKKAGADIWDLRHTRDEFRILAVAPHIQGAVNVARTFDGSAGFTSRWEGKEGDTLNAAVTISNSETGHGGLHANVSILRKVCLNFCVWADGVARIHLGKKIAEVGEVFFSDETRKKEDELVWMKIRDVIRNSFDPKLFAQKIDAMNAATQRNLGTERPAGEIVDVTVAAFGLPVERREAILEELLTSADRTQYGLAQAITAQSNPKNAGKLDDEARSRFDDVGGTVIALGDAEWKKLLTMPVRKARELAAAASSD